MTVFERMACRCMRQPMTAAYITNAVYEGSSRRDLSFPGWILDL